MPYMRITHVCSSENYGVIPVIFSQMVNKNFDVDASFQQKFKCHSNKMSCGHCNYPNAVFSVKYSTQNGNQETKELGCRIFPCISSSARRKKTRDYTTQAGLVLYHAIVKV